MRIFLLPRAAKVECGRALEYWVSRPRTAPEHFPGDLDTAQQYRATSLKIRIGAEGGGADTMGLQLSRPQHGVYRTGGQSEFGGEQVGLHYNQFHTLCTQNKSL